MFAIVVGCSEEGLRNAESPAKFIMWLDQAKRIRMEFVRIPAGRFRMGSADGDSDEKWVRQVTISKDFWLQTTEVTQAQWEAVTGSKPSQWKGADLPVEMVSWDDCQDFVRRLNEKYRHDLKGKEIRLPTETEWEYACRAGNTGKWCFGAGEAKLEEYAWYVKNSGKQTHPVGQKKPNGWGLYDMHGNVCEWCQDWYDSYDPDKMTDPTGPMSGPCRVLRGGAWYYFATVTRSTCRNGDKPTDRCNFVGLRVLAASR